MSIQDFTFTSESVSAGHPDKVCDQLSDAVLDGYLDQDPDSRVACEALVAPNLCVLAGEITSKGKLDHEDLVRNVVREIGYVGIDGFDADSIAVRIRIGHQSADISQGVTVGQGEHEEQGAGDQGLMFGFACNDTEELMPLPISLAQRLTRKLHTARESGEIGYLRPDAKSQVSVEFEGGKAKRISTVVISTQHDEAASNEQIYADVRDKVIRTALPAELFDEETIVHINPTGRFVVGGPAGDCGLTGRKIIVDTYGGWSRHGGGAFSGKDPSKVDRSAAYMARYLAKNVVAAGLAESCEVQLAYAIGVAQPVSVLVDTFGSSSVDAPTIAGKLIEHVDLRPASIVERFQLKRPIYRPTAAYGHFGRKAEKGLFPWEQTDLAGKLG